MSKPLFFSISDTLVLIFSFNTKRLTSSLSERALMISTYLSSTLGRRGGGKLILSCGHASHTASCFSHSAGIRKLRERFFFILVVGNSWQLFGFFNKFIRNQIFIGIRTAVAQKSPALAKEFVSRKIQFLHQYFFFVLARSFQNFPKRVSDKRLAKKFFFSFCSNAVYCRYIQTIGYGVSAHRCLPRSEEHTSELQSQSNLVCRLLLEKKLLSFNALSLANLFVSIC